MQRGQTISTRILIPASNEYSFTILVSVSISILKSIYSNPLTHTTRRNETKRNEMQIKVKTLTGRDMPLDVEPQDKIIRIKEMMEEKEGISPAQQRLIFNGSQLNDDQTVQESGIQAGSSLHLVLTLRGGN